MTQPFRQRFALTFICFTILIDTIGFGVIIPVMPQLIMELTGEDISHAALYGGWLLFLYSLMQFVFAPILGSLSDRYGRRPVLLFSLFAFGCDYLIMGFSQTIVWLFIGRGLAGIAGATMAAASAYVADISAPEKRAQNFGLLGALWGLGFILGPAIGGVLGEYGHRIPFFAAAGLAFVNVIYGLFVLPESHAKENRREVSLLRANPVGALIHMRQYPIVIGLLGVLFFCQIAHEAYPSTWTYYTIEAFGWSVRDVGLSLMFVGIMVVVVQGGLIRVVNPRLGERKTVILGLTCLIVGFSGYAFATEGWMIYPSLGVASLGGLAMPALRGMMANAVPANAQGELQGATTSLVSLTQIAAPIILTRMFHYFTSDGAPIYFPGIPFFTGAIVLTIGLILYITVARRVPESG